MQRSGDGVTVVVVTESDCRSEFLTDWALPVYVTWVTLSIYVIPIITLISVYSRICLAVWRSERFKRTVSRTPQQALAANRRSCSSLNQTRTTATSFHCFRIRSPLIVANNRFDCNDIHGLIESESKEVKTCH